MRTNKQSIQRILAECEIRLIDPRLDTIPVKGVVYCQCYPTLRHILLTMGEDTLRLSLKSITESEGCPRLVTSSMVKGLALFFRHHGTKFNRFDRLYHVLDRRLLDEQMSYFKRMFYGPTHTTLANFLIAMCDGEDYVHKADAMPEETKEKFMKSILTQNPGSEVVSLENEGRTCMHYGIRSEIGGEEYTDEEVAHLLTRITEKDTMFARMMNIGADRIRCLVEERDALQKRVDEGVLLEASDIKHESPKVYREPTISPYEGD